MNSRILYKIIESWHTVSETKELENILSWIEEKNTKLKVSIIKNKLSDSDFWFYDDTVGEIRNKNNSFFQICGLQQYRDGELVLEQPILIQNEIGYLGIICKEINEKLYFLMQAKIEPGNINKIQISPTLQATKSNFMQKHGGKKPAYLEYFLDAKLENILVDQIQSEQSSRFLGKRNRNIIIIVQEEIELLDNYRWLTLGTIKKLMEIDNLVNMDTRTVLSCIPYSKIEISKTEREEIELLFHDKSLFKSMFAQPSQDKLTRVFRYMNNYKMLHSCENKIIPLMQMKSWNVDDMSITHCSKYPFKVVFCDIEIEGREVTRWSQPLFEAHGMATFGLITSVIDEKLMFLVQIKPEAGCFDSIELAPSVQLEASVSEEEYSEIDKRFFQLFQNGAEVRNNTILSEEGGRFYHEQNRNIILRIEQEQMVDLPDGYFWIDYATLNEMVQFNNVLNIQLRNLLSILEI